MYNGIINVYKEAGFTSHDVVAKLRGILKQKKIGHTGTLDPDATGVLPVCLGSGTKLCDMLTDRSKEYKAVLRLGISTDTEDMTGTVLEEKEVNCDESMVRDTINSFIGEYDQIPPMYSALKVNGQKLCDLARKGIVIERKPRRITIENIEIISMKLPEVTLKISCSKGTYIRSLCRDIGNKLGVCGCMKSLERIRVGIFEAKNSLKLSQIEELAKNNTLNDKIVPVDSLFLEYKEVIVSERNEMLVKNGNPIVPDAFYGDKIRIYLSDKKFAGIYFYDCNLEVYKPLKMFLNGND